MDERLITPHQTKLEKFKNEVSGFSPNVKAALIGAPVALLVALLGMVGGCLKVSGDNAQLKSENAELRRRVHALEQEVAPFRNLAVQEFRSADAASMKKLAELLVTLKNDYSNSAVTVDGLRAEVDKLRRATPQRRQMMVATAHEIIRRLKLTNIKSVTIFAQTQDLDTMELCTAMVRLFKEASVNTRLEAISAGLAYGVKVVAKNPNDDKLQDAFKPLFDAIGEQPNFRENTKLDQTALEIYVGAAFPKN